MPPIDPTALVRATEWSVGPLEGDIEAGRAPGGAPGVSFGDVMAKQVASLSELQAEAADASRQVALGTSEDPSSAVLAVERARLSMQLAVAVRGKLTEAFNDVMHTQI
jgi:flagellar hook-basal body complex protein FliE